MYMLVKIIMLIVIYTFDKYTMIYKKLLVQPSWRLGNNSLSCVLQLFFKSKLFQNKNVLKNIWHTNNTISLHYMPLVVIQ